MTESTQKFLGGRFSIDGLKLEDGFDWAQALWGPPERQSESAVFRRSMEGKEVWKWPKAREVIFDRTRGEFEYIKGRRLEWNGSLLLSSGWSPGGSFAAGAAGRGPSRRHGV